MAETCVMRLACRRSHETQISQTITGTKILCTPGFAAGLLKNKQNYCPRCNLNPPLAAWPHQWTGSHPSTLQHHKTAAKSNHVKDPRIAAPLFTDTRLYLSFEVLVWLKRNTTRDHTNLNHAVVNTTLDPNLLWNICDIFPGSQPARKEELNTHHKPGIRPCPSRTHTHTHTHTHT